jgi:hypothetical protein
MVFLDLLVVEAAVEVVVLEEVVRLVVVMEMDQVTVLLQLQTLVVVVEAVVTRAELAAPAAQVSVAYGGLNKENNNELCTYQ